MAKRIALPWTQEIFDTSTQGGNVIINADGSVRIWGKSAAVDPNRMFGARAYMQIPVSPGSTLKINGDFSVADIYSHQYGAVAGFHVFTSAGQELLYICAYHTAPTYLGKVGDPNRFLLIVKNAASGSLGERDVLADMAQLGMNTNVTWIQVGPAARANDGSEGGMVGRVDATFSNFVATTTTPPKMNTSIMMETNTYGGTAPYPIYLAATLTDINGAALNGKTVDLYENDVKILSATTAIMGVVEFNFTRNAGVYAYQTRFAGDDSYLASSSNTINITVTTTPSPTTLNLGVSPATGQAPLTFILTAHLLDQSNVGIPAKPIDFYENGTKVGTVKTTTGGLAQRARTKGQGTYSYYAQFAGDSQYQGCP
jgi:hypothetical protein